MKLLIRVQLSTLFPRKIHFLFFREFPKKIQFGRFRNYRLAPSRSINFIVCKCQSTKKLPLGGLKHHGTRCNNFQTDLGAFSWVNIELNLVLAQF